MKSIYILGALKEEHIDEVSPTNPHKCTACSKEDPVYILLCVEGVEVLMCKECLQTCINLIDKG